jgi:hypothetical protein
MSEFILKRCIPETVTRQPEVVALLKAVEDVLKWQYPDDIPPHEMKALEDAFNKFPEIK